MMSYSRGEIYFVEKFKTFGSEQWSGRPGIIVSGDLNRHNSTVVMVYLTTQPKREMITHVPIYATGLPSTAICEQIHTVDCRRLGRFCGKCSEAEMRAVDVALQASLGLSRIERCLLCGKETVCKV